MPLYYPPAHYRAVGNTAGATSSGPGSFVLAGGPNITLSGATGAGVMTLSISAAAPGGGDGTVSSATTASRVESVNVVGADAGRYALEGHQHEGLWQVSVGGNTSGGNTSAGAGSFMLAGGPNITLSGATAAGGMTLSISGPAAGGTANLFMPYDEVQLVAGQVGQGTLHMHPVGFPNVAFDRVGFRINYSNATNSTGSITISKWFGLYTKNASTLSLLSSTSGNYALTFSGTVGDFSLNGGPRIMTVGWTQTLTGREYWVAVISRTTSGGANATISQFLQSQMASAHSGVMGAASAASQQRILGWGTYSATTSALPASIAFSQLTGSGSAVHRPPAWFLLNGTA